jgi:hypothetical protein
MVWSIYRCPCGAIECATRHTEKGINTAGCSLGFAGFHACIVCVFLSPIVVTSVFLFALVVVAAFPRWRIDCEWKHVSEWGFLTESLV